MNHDYKDIRDLIAEEPRWFNEEAVPRYCDFSPRETANIYINECCLLLIECQGCGRSFHVCISRGRYETLETARTLGSFVKDNELHYGDPPNVGCCAAGPTMNSIPRRVLEFWRRLDGEWARVPDLEREITPDWMTVDASTATSSLPAAATTERASASPGELS